MTINFFKIEELRDVKGWFKLTFKSNGKGDQQTTQEMIVSEEALRFIRHSIARALGEQPDYRDLPDNLREFMEDRE